MKNCIFPIYHGKRIFLGLKDLVVSFYTRKCQFKCSFCNLPLRSSKEEVPAREIMKQVDWVFEQYQDELQTFQQLSVGNEGSILDQKSMPLEAINYLLTRAKQMSKLEVLSLETRPEFIQTEILDNILSKIDVDTVDVTIGFETQDDYIRNNILKKNISRKKIEDTIKLLGIFDIRLTSYVLLKPNPSMSEREGIKEAIITIEYLAEKCSDLGVPLVIYLNPMFIACNTPLAKSMKRQGYKPPSIHSILEIILKTKKLGIPIYTGLWSESLSVEGGDFKNKSDYNENIFKKILTFNKE